MAVSPPPAIIMSSAEINITDEAPKHFGSKVHQYAWRQIVKKIPIGGPALNPIPFIEKTHYFDLLSVFAEEREDIFDKAMNTVVETKKFKYVGSLKSIIRFEIEDKNKMQDIVQVKDQTPSTSKDLIEHSVMGKPGNVQVNYHLHIENPHVHAFHFNLDPEVLTGIDRNTPGLQDTAALMIVAEVFSGSGVFIMTEKNYRSEDTKNELFHYGLENDPIPLAFAALRISVSRNGLFDSPPEVVPPRALADLDSWILKQDKPPEDSPCIKTLTNGQMCRLRGQAANFRWPGK